MTKEQFIGWFNRNKAVRFRTAAGSIVYEIENATFTKFKNLCKEAGITYEWEDIRAVARTNDAKIYFYKNSSRLCLEVR